jgi:hypothetical protein
LDEAGVRRPVERGIIGGSRPVNEDIVFEDIEIFGYVIEPFAYAIAAVAVVLVVLVNIKYPIRLLCFMLRQLQT